MLYAFIRRGSLVERIEILAGHDVPADAFWLDLFEPGADEVARVEAALEVSLPSREEMKEIEPSSRLYLEGGGVYGIGWHGSRPWQATAARLQSPAAACTIGRTAQQEDHDAPVHDRRP